MTSMVKITPSRAAASVSHGILYTDEDLEALTLCSEDPSEMFAAIFGGEAFQDW